jgi:hypothetical protein
VAFAAKNSENNVDVICEIVCDARKYMSESERESEGRREMRTENMKYSFIVSL